MGMPEGKTIVLAGAIGTSDEIAATGAFPLSDQAGYITGPTIAVDGGLTMRN